MEDFLRQYIRILIQGDEPSEEDREYKDKIILSFESCKNYEKLTFKEQEKEIKKIQQNTKFIFTIICQEIYNYTKELYNFLKNRYQELILTNKNEYNTLYLKIKKLYYDQFFINGNKIVTELCSKIPIELALQTQHEFLPLLNNDNELLYFYVHNFYMPFIKFHYVGKRSVISTESFFNDHYEVLWKYFIKDDFLITN